MEKRCTLGKVNQSLRVLITGGFGYMGGRVAQYLADQGHQIVLASRKKSTPEWLSQAEVVQLRWNDEDVLTELCKDINAVIHCAGINAQDCASDPIAALEFNGLATARLVQAGKKAGVTKFIYLSTAHVYRFPLVGRIDENTCPRNLHPYATSHLAGENAVLYSSETGADLSGVVLRLSNVVGAPVHKDVDCWMLVANDLCRQVVTTGKMLIRSSGKQARDFVSMKFVCDLISKILIAPNHQYQSIINVGSSKSITIKELARMIQTACQSLFAFRPPIQVISTSVVPADTSLFYQTCWQNISSIQPDHIEEDIIDTLNYCKQEWFE